jgi:ABC-type Fe3+/spermidine/putrescine transport system ATPase subunit
VGERLRLALRPEDVDILPASSLVQTGLDGLVHDIVFLGERQLLRVQLADGKMIEAVQISTKSHAFERGAAVKINLPADRMRVLGA